jgi:hypothetical protein
LLGTSVDIHCNFSNVRKTEVLKSSISYTGMGNDWQGKSFKTNEHVTNVQKCFNMFQADEKLKRLGIGSNNFNVEVRIISVFLKVLKVSQH